MKTSKFVPLTGTIGGIAAIIIDAIINQQINENMFMVFIAATVGGSSALAIVKKLKK